jgi:hypothetical protein
MHDKDELCPKIIEMYPEIGEGGLDIKVSV